MHWAFVAAWGLSLVLVSGGTPLLWSMGSRACRLQHFWPMDSVVMLPGLSCPWHVESSPKEMEPLSCALAGGFLTIGPPGTSIRTFLKMQKNAVHNTHTHTCIHAHTHTRAHTHTHTHPFSNLKNAVHNTHTHTCIHAHTRTRAHTHTHTPL